MVKWWKHKANCLKLATKNRHACTCGLEGAPPAPTDAGPKDRYAMRRVTMGFELKAGEFRFMKLIGSEYHDAKEPGEVTHFSFRDELENNHIIPVVEAHRQANGACWHWNGNMDCPTITPSILSYYDPPNKPRHVYWHGFVTAGRLCPCSDSPKEGTR